MANILLAVTGSISAYKAADLTNQLTKNGHQVQVLMSPSATAFITPLTLQSLSKRAVITELMEEVDPSAITHIELGKWSDLFLVVPASADTIAKLAHGFADNIVTATALALAADRPKFIAPAMNTNMYQHPATQKNLETLSQYGYQIITPRSALLACGDVGMGALADLPTILDTIQEALTHEK